VPLNVPQQWLGFDEAARGGSYPFADLQTTASSPAAAVPPKTRRRLPAAPATIPNAVPHLSQQFFATVQYQMHWAARGLTAAEIVHERADGKKYFMGMQTTRPGGVVRDAIGRVWRRNDAR